MKRHPGAFLVGLLALILIFPACSAQARQTAEQARRARIAENLKFQFEQLREAQVTVTELEDAGIAGMDIGTLVIDNQNRLRFLVTRDDRQLFLLAADPVDVSKTREELEEELAQRGQAERDQARQRHAELLAASAGAPSRGPADAPVTIVEFSDFQCPFCARVVPTVEQVLEKYPDQVRLVFMHLPLSMHPWAEPAAVAAGCAARQSTDAFWSLHDFYFGNQDSVSPQNVMAVSRAQLDGAGLDLAQWNTCATDTTSVPHQEVLARVRASAAMAQQYGATGTPAFFINGRFVSGAQPLELFDEVIGQALSEDGQP